MNNVVLIGRITKNPEVRYTPAQTAVCTFTLAVDRSGKDGADFPRVTCFGKTAENVGQFISKGRQLAVIGRIQTGSYEKNGQKVFTTDVIADRVEFLGTAQKTEDPAPEFQAIDEQVPF